MAKKGPSINTLTSECEGYEHNPPIDAKGLIREYFDPFWQAIQIDQIPYRFSQRSMEFEIDGLTWRICFPYHEQFAYVYGPEGSWIIGFKGGTLSPSLQLVRAIMAYKRNEIAWEIGPCGF